MELSSEEKWKVIKDGIDKYCKDFTEDAKVIINPINKDLVQGNYKGCIFEYDKRIEIDGFIIDYCTTGQFQDY